MWLMGQENKDKEMTIWLSNVETYIYVEKHSLGRVIRTEAWLSRFNVEMEEHKCKQKKIYLTLTDIFTIKWKTG